VRLTLQPLAATAADDAVPVRGADGPVGSLWTRVLDWTCRDRRLRMQVLAAEPVTLPGSEPSEPAVGALARLNQALHGSGAVLVLREPASVFTPERISFAEGVRLFGVATPEDEACWDAALSRGQPVYGLRGQVACECRSAHPAAVISALAYGLFTCEEGLALERLDEDRGGVGYGVGAAIEGEVEAAVIIRGGFEAARLRGRSARWDDRGNETYVRLVVRSSAGACWTQPRFVAPRGSAAGHTGSHGH
jgi:hypothetical protein